MMGNQWLIGLLQTGDRVTTKFVVLFNKLFSAKFYEDL